MTSPDQEPRRNRQLQDYTDRFGRDRPEPRLSRADEQRFAERADEQQGQRRRDQLAELERRVAHAERAIERVREYTAELGPAFARGPLRAIDDHFRRARGLLVGLADGLRSP